MPKAKDSASLPPDKIRPADVKAFLADLEGDEDLPVQEEPEELPVARGKQRHVPVAEEGLHQPEEPATASTKRVITPTPEIDQVFDRGADEPPAQMQKFQRGPKKPFAWGWVIGGVAILALAAVAGFFWFNQANRFTNEKVHLTITTSAEAASGNDLDITFQYQNLEPVDLVDAELTVEYPEGFTIEQTSQASVNEFQNAFALGTIRSGRAGSLTVEGSIFGSVGTERVFSATLTYRPENFNSDFQVSNEVTVKITSSILELSLDGPKKLAPNAMGTWTISYENTSDRDLENVQIEAVYPNGVEVTNVDPAAVERSALWRFETVEQGATGKITVTGTASGDVGDTLEFIVRAGIVTSTNTVDLQAEQKLLVVLIDTGLSTTVTVNGQSEQSVISPGETLEYVVQVSNKSEAEIADVTVAITLEGEAVDMTELENSTEAEVEDRTLTWTKENVLALELLKPGQDATIRFSVGSKSPLTVTDDDDIDQTITAKVVLSAPSVPVPEGGAQPTSFVTKIATVFGLTAESRRYDDSGVAVGIGPVPPVVGQTSTYRIIWSVTNTTSDANTLTVSAILPNHVFWTGQNIGRSAGDVTFDPETRTVSWTLNKVPAGTGSRLPKLTAHFEVSITPTADQVGTSVILANTASAKATDAFTARAIATSQPSVTSDIPTDPIEPGAGTVQAQ